MRRKIFYTLGSILSCIFLLNILVGWMDKPSSLNPADIEKATTKSLLLLQKSGYKFINANRAKCAGCHHNTMTAMVAGLARQKGIPVIDSFTLHRITALENNIINVCNPNYNNEFVAANFIAPYTLLGLYAEKYPPNLYTDIAVDLMIGQARPDGAFLTEGARVPLESGEIHLASMAIRAIQVYATPAKKIQVNELVTRTRQFLEKSNPTEQQELAFQLLGMQWCGSSQEHKIKVAEKLKLMQNADGGWSQLATMQSDAYATGQTLYALYESGMVKPDDPEYQKAINYLLKTQNEEGAWVVATRAYPIQPFFTSGFPPYDENQYISATATNWAALALLNALPDKKIN
jgi:hypothetical protein